MSVVQTEHVLVVPTELFHQLGHFQGFSADAERYLDELLSPANVRYRPRSEMEEDPSFKQLIPYVIFCHTDQEGTQSVFQYVRGQGQGEKRLHRKRSIGVGGHICSDDAEGAGDLNPYEEGMRRELAEEVILDTPYTQRCVGLINDDQTEVGKVHLGVVHLVDVTAPTVRAREADLLEGGFQPSGKLLDDLQEFESWSQICLESLFSE